MLSKALIEAQEAADAEGGEEKRHGEPRGVDGQEENAAGNGLAGGGQGEHGGEDRADAGSPSEGESETEKEAAPHAGLRAGGAQADVAIEPAGHGRAEETDQREREKMNVAETGE